MPKPAKYQNNSKNDPYSGACAPPRGTMFLYKNLILVSSVSHLSIFQNYKVENFKNLEILQSKRNFFNFLQTITFDTFMLAH